MDRIKEKIQKKRGRPASNLVAAEPLSIMLMQKVKQDGRAVNAIEDSGNLPKGTISNVLKSGNATIKTVWQIEDALGLQRGVLCSADRIVSGELTQNPNILHLQNKSNVPKTETPLDQIPPGNALRRKGDEDVSHKVLHLRAIGSAAALERGTSSRGGFDDETLYWDSIEEIPESTHLVRVVGDSMEPLMMHGQSVMVGTQYRTEIGEMPRNRDIVLVEITVRNNDIGGMDGMWEGVHCKRIQDGGDFWEFTSINPKGESFNVAKDNCRLWHVIGVYFGEKSSIPEED